MTKEQKAAFTSRISQSNKSELVCVLYDIFFAYMEDTKSEDAKEQMEGYRKAGQVLEHLKEALNFRYELSKQLFPLYDYFERVLAKAMYRGRTEEVEEVEKMMHELAEAFEQAAKEDDSEPLMQNTQQRMAGYTYGRTDVTETTADYDADRGFLA